MSPHLVTVTDDRNVFCWHFQNAGHRSSVAAAAVAAASSGDGDDSSSAAAVGTTQGGGGRGGGGTSRVRMFDAASSNSGMFSAAQSAETYVTQFEAVPDPITCCCSSDRYLVLARKSGAITRFTVPHLTEENSYFLKDREPQRIELNCHSNKIALVDAVGLFTVLDLDARVSDSEEKNREDDNGDPHAVGARLQSNDDDDAPAGDGGGSKRAPRQQLMSIGTYFGKKLNIERKDVWDVKWSEDDPDMFVLMEKTKMVF
jgi:hypothetical protein